MYNTSSIGGVCGNMDHMNDEKNKDVGAKNNGPHKAWATHQARVSAEHNRWDSAHENAMRTQQESLAVEISQQRRLTPRNVWKRITSKRTLTSLLVFSTLIAVGIAPSILTLRNAAEEGIDPALIRRIQVGFQQQSNLDGEGFDLLEPVNGGELQSISSTAQGEHGADRIHDGLFDPQFNAWRSADHKLPLTMLFHVKFRTPIQKVVIWNHPDESSETYIKEFELLGSVEDPTTNPDAMTLLGRFTVDNPDSKVVFEVEAPTSIRFATISILSTFGTAEYVSAAELGLFGLTRDPGQIPIPRGSGPIPI